ncbi:MAG: serine/threonine protein phosphatase, partial [Oscillospiraceae bacterium]|nr:serine/threonine protein phosphatase [Oscillospiraceae bacterium]
MSVNHKLDKLFAASERVEFDDRTCIVLMSDIHRGDGSWADDFAVNSTLYSGALTQYYQDGFTYIELGDGDELWKN